MNMINECVIDFGLVEPGKCYKKNFCLPNGKPIQSYGQLYKTNSLDKVFDLKFNSEQKEHSLLISYFPTLAFRKSVDYFCVYDFDLNNYNLCLKGQTTGPNIICKKNILNFEITGNYSTIKKSIQLDNLSKMNSKFAFDVDTKECPIQIIPVSGTIEQGKSVKVIISYSPKRYGYYYKRLFCIVEHQSPIVIYIYGSWFKTYPDLSIRDGIKFIQNERKFSNNYIEYFNDMTIQENSIFYINKRYIDMGNVNLKQNEIGTKNSFIVKNNSGITVYLNWEQDSKRVFLINPTKREIMNDFLYEFTVQFIPKIPDRLHGNEFDATISWGPNREFTAPFQLSVHLIGTTFDTDCYGWIPEYKLNPSIIILPPTVPDNPSYTNFTIRKKGHIPILFKFIRPLNSNYIVKPMQGLITENFIVGIVQLLPGFEASINYYETWEILLNTNKKISVKILGNAEFPFLNIETNNCLVIPSTNIYSISHREFSIRNLTRHSIILTIEHDKPNVLNFIEQNAEIGPHEIYYCKYSFCPIILGDFRSTLRFVEKILINSYEFKLISVIKITAVCTNSDIICWPNSSNYGNMLCGNWIYGNIKIRNDGVSELTLNLDLHALTSTSKLKKKSIEPNEFLLKSKEIKDIRIGFRIDSVGPHLFGLMNRLTNNSFQELMNVQINCAVPSIKILDIRIVDAGSIFSKLCFWKLLQINITNDALNTLKPGKVKAVLSKLPSFFNNSKILVQFMLETPDIFDTTVFEINRFITCDCKYPDHWKNALRCIGKKNHCKHLDDFYFTPSTIRFNKNEKKIINFFINNQRTGDDAVFNFNIYDSKNPEIKSSLSYVIQSEKSISEIDKYGLYLTECDGVVTVNLEPSFVGDINPPIQAIWMYNNQQSSISYYIVYEDANDFYEKAFNCYNTNGAIESTSVQPILILFRPLQLKKYLLTIRLFIGEKRYLIHVYGEGIHYKNLQMVSTLMKMPVSSKFSSPISCASLSLDHLLVGPIPIHFEEKKIIFLKNNTNEILAFTWSQVHIGGLLKVTVKSSRGVLQPRKIIPCQIFVKSLTYPVRFTILLDCKIDNLSQLLVRKKNVEIIKTVTTLYDQCFTITEKGYESPHISVSLGDKLMPQYLVVSLSILTFNDNNSCSPNIDKQLIISANSNLHYNTNLNIDQPVHQDVIRNILSRVVGEIINCETLLTSITEKKRNLFYCDVKENSNKIIKEKISTKNLQNILHTAIYEVVTELFLSKRSRRFKHSNLKTNYISVVEDLKNDYFKHLLKHTLFQYRNSKDSEAISEIDSVVGKYEIDSTSSYFYN